MPCRTTLLSSCAALLLAAGVLGQAPDPASQLPEEAVLLVEIPAPARTLERLLGSEPWRRFQAGPLPARLQSEPGFAASWGLVRFLAGQAGTDMEGLVPAMAGGGAALALLPPEQPDQAPPFLLALRPEDADAAESILVSLLSMASPEAVVEQRDGLLFAASDRSLMDAVRSPTAPPSGLARARALLPDADLRLAASGTWIRASGMEPRPADAGASLLASALHESLLHADAAWAGWTLGATSTRFEVLVPTPPSLAETHAPFLPPPAPILLPRMPDGLAAGVLRRDLGAWWSERDRFLMPAGLLETTEADTGLGLLFGRDPGPELLAWLEPEIRFVLARAPLSEPLAAEFPAGALGLRLRPDAPEEIVESFASAFLAAVTLANFEEGSQSRDPLLLDLERLPDGTRVYSSRYRPWAGDEPAPVRHNLSPALACRPDGQVWIATSTGLLLALLEAPEVGLRPAGDLLELETAPWRALLEANREPLLAAWTLEEGGDELAALRRFEDLAAALGLADGATIHRRPEAGFLGLALELRWHAR